MAKKTKAGAKAGPGKTKKPGKARAAPKPRPAAQKPAEEAPAGAGEVIGKLLESPLMVDLIAVGATAALAAITEHRFSHRAGAAGGSKTAAKAAATAAAAAMGRRIAVEVEEVMKASKKPKPGAAR